MDRRRNFRATSNFLHSCVFKEYIFQFDRLVGVSGREWFRFWCMDVVPRGRLDVGDGSADSILQIVEFLLDNKGMPFIMSIVRRFLLETGDSKSLEILSEYELRVIVDILLENYVTSNCSETASSFYADALRLMATTRRKSEKRISEISDARDQFRQVHDGDVRGLELLNNVIKECQRRPEFSWHEVTMLLTITGEWYINVSLDYDKVSIIDLTSKIGESFADWMLELGGLVSMLGLSKCVFLF